MPENISNIAKYNIENGTHFGKLSQVNQHKQQKASEEFKKKHPILASFTKSAQDARDAKIGAIGAGQVRDLYNTGNNALASELNQKYLGANATGILSVPIGSEIATYGLLGGGLRLGAGTATGAAGSGLGGKAGDLADKQFGTNGIGTAGRIGGGFAGFVPGMNAATRVLRTAAGKGITLHMPQETFMNLRGQYFNNAGNKALVNLNSKSNPILTSTINHLYKEYPELSSIGPKEAYRQYYETIFPASKVQTPYAHGTKSDLSGGLETSVKIPNAAAPETIGRNDFYLNLQPEASLQYADGIGVPKGFTWNKHRFWLLKEILGKPYKSDAGMSKPIKLREQVPNRAGQFSRVKNADGTYSGHGKLLEEYKSELGMQDLSNEEFLQRLGVQDEESFNQGVAKNRQMFSDIYDSGDYHGLYHVKIDANNPLTINGGDTYYSERGIWDRMNKGGNDVLLHNNAANEFGSDVAVVRDVTPQKVRILGSKPDQQGFADFIGGKQRFFTEIPTSPQEVVTTYHFDGRMPFSKPISEAERLGIPKALRSNPKALEDPQYGGYQQGNQRYNAAVESGNLDEIQRLRDLHFKIKAPHTAAENVVSHGSKTSDNTFNIFNTDIRKNGGNGELTGGAFFGSGDQQALNQFARDSKLRQFYLNIEKPNIIDAQNRRYDNLLATWLTPEEVEARVSGLRKNGFSKSTIEDGLNKTAYGGTAEDYAVKTMSDKNYDSLIIKNIYEGGMSKDYGTPITDYVATKPTQIKLGDSKTYDNAGKIIPIVKRDNFRNPDIRYKQGGILKQIK